MALVTTNIKDNFTTDAEFRTFCTAIHNFLDASSLVQTADSGQINLATVVKPAAATTVGGYEVWRFDDADQTAAPIYFKIEYASNGTAGGNNPAVWITVGSGSDGAGTITATALPSAGSVQARKQISQSTSGTAATVTLACYFDYLSDGSGFVMALWPSTAAGTVGGMGFAIERFRDADGTPNADGFNMFYFAQAAAGGVCAFDGRFYAAAATQPAASVASWSVPYAGLGTANASALLGTIIYPWPVFTGVQPRIAGPSQLLLAIGKSDLAVGATFAMDHYGTSRTWLALGGGAHASQGWGALASGGGLVQVVMRGD